MIESRRMPIPHAPARRNPSSSGPRCTVTCAMAFSAARSTGLSSKCRTPKIPHMRVHAFGAVCGQDLPEELELALGGGLPAELLGIGSGGLAIGILTEELPDAPGEGHRAALLEDDPSFRG